MGNHIPDKPNMRTSTEFKDINYSSTTLLANGGSVVAGQSVTLCCGTVGYLNGQFTIMFAIYTANSFPECI